MALATSLRSLFIVLMLLLSGYAMLDPKLPWSVRDPMERRASSPNCVRPLPNTDETFLGHGPMYLPSVEEMLSAADIAWHIQCYTAALHHAWITPNAMLYAWESDLLTVTPERHVWEIEIKCTRADLKQELKKPKHAQGMLMNGSFQVKPDGIGRTWGEQREEDRRLNGEAECRRPNYYCFAMPCTVYRRRPQIRIPSYAGVFTVDDRGRVFQERPPILLHEKKIASKDLLGLARRIHHRYWNEIRKARHEGTGTEPTDQDHGADEVGGPESGSR